MIEFEWEKKGTRSDAAALLRELADSLDGKDAVELEHDGWELKLDAPTQLEMGVEVEVSDDEVELEVELRWSRRKRAAKPSAG